MRNWHFNHIDFSTYPAYGKGDLGVSRTPEKTLFRLWAPTARTVDLRLYTAGKGGKPLRIIAMERAEGGTWLHEEPADLQGLYYTFRVHDGEWLHEVPDPYARAVGVNGLRGMVIDLAATNPQGGKKTKAPALKRLQTGSSMRPISGTSPSLPVQAFTTRVNTWDSQRRTPVTPPAKKPAFLT